MSKAAQRDAEANQFSEVLRNFRTGAYASQFYKDSYGWILFGPRDIRRRQLRYQFCLQMLTGQKAPRVKAGCRYLTLAQAWRHWSNKLKKSTFRADKNEARQALAIVRLMLLQAQAYGLLSPYASLPKFDSTIIKRNFL